MKQIAVILALSVCLACSKKVEPPKNDEQLKTDMQRIGEKLKAGAEKARDSEAAKRAEEKAGEELEKAGRKLKDNAEKPKEKR